MQQGVSVKKQKRPLSTGMPSPPRGVLTFSSKTQGTGWPPSNEVFNNLNTWRTRPELCGEGAGQEREGGFQCDGTQYAGLWPGQWRGGTQYAGLWPELTHLARQPLPEPGSADVYAWEAGRQQLSVLQKGREGGPGGQGVRGRVGG